MNVGSGYSLLLKECWSSSLSPNSVTSGDRVKHVFGKFWSNLIIFLIKASNMNNNDVHFDHCLFANNTFCNLNDELEYVKMYQPPFHSHSQLTVSLPITFHLDKNWVDSGCSVDDPDTISKYTVYSIHDDLIKWKKFRRYWPFVRGIHRSPVNSPHKGQWRGVLKFSLVCAWINGRANNRSHYDVIVMIKYTPCFVICLVLVM